jgi:hypothetical protein
MLPNGHDRIQVFAYRIWLAAGRPEGRDGPIYAEAERIVRELSARVHAFHVQPETVRTADDD